MSERKVLNKYYPPDYDPSKIPKVKQEKNRQWNIRIMAPFNMRCNTCGEYVYKGKKFNSRKEDVEGERTYMDLKVFRFYIKCPRCVAEIAFRTDPENADYALEGGATRNFEALRTAEQLAQKQALDKEEEEKNNPMKVLENRTKASQREMDMIETLEELRELNARQAQTDHDHMIKVHKAYEEQLQKLQDEDDEQFISSLFGKNGETKIKRIADIEDDEEVPPRKTIKQEKPTDILIEQTSSEPSTTVKKNTEKKSLWQTPTWQTSGGGKSSLSGLVKKKPQLLVKPKGEISKNQEKKHIDTSSNDKEESCSNPIEKDKKLENNCDKKTERKSFDESLHAKVNETKETVKPSGLSLLGDYSDSGSSEDDT